MKNPKPQPTSYKDFLEQVTKTKTARAAPPRETPRANNNSTANLHTQSTSLWDKKSQSQARLQTEYSAEKKIRSYNHSYNQSYNQSQNQSHNQSVQQQNRGKSKARKDRVLCFQKFVTEATSSIVQLFKAPAMQLLNSKVSYIQYLQCLKVLKLINESYEPYPNDLVSQLWSEHVSGNNFGSFVVTMASILGLCDGKQTEQDQFLKCKFQSLRYTRMELSRGASNLQNQQNECTFRPQISDRSRKLAQSSSKSKRNQGSKTKYLHSQRGALTDRINTSGCQSKNGVSVYEEQNENTCLNGSSAHLKTDRTGIKRSEILYERAKQKSAERRVDKSSNQVQYEKSIQQLTFKPKILKIKGKDKSSQQTSKCFVKGQKNAVSRLIRGRVQRQVRKVINDKGSTYNQKVADRMRRQKYQQITLVTNYDSIPDTDNSFETTMALPRPTKPLFEPKYEQPAKQFPSTPEQDLVIDVYISQDHKEKLVIRKGESLDQVASQFIEKHGLPAEKKEQLVQLLEVSINHALCPIDELVEEEDELASARTHYRREPTFA